MATKILTVHFTNGGVPATGLSPTIDIYELDPLVPGTNVLVVNDGSTVEIGGGWYRYQFTTYDNAKSYVFTFDGGAGLSAYERYKVGGNEAYVEEVVGGVWDETATNHVAAGTTGLLLNQIKADTASIVLSEVAITDYLLLLLKYQQNRTRIDLANSTLIIYDNDGTTPMTVFELRDFNGMPNVQEVCEKIPTLNP